MVNQDQTFGLNSNQIIIKVDKQNAYNDDVKDLQGKLDQHDLSMQSQSEIQV